MNSEEVMQMTESESFLRQHGKASLVETHISWVILTALYAYKIKKPVQFSFLDFSTLEKRKYYCEREVVLNKRLAAEMYLGVVPIFRNMKTLSFDSGAGDPVDYAVFMKRMDTAKEMDKLLAGGNVNENVIKRLAAKIAVFHRQANIIKSQAGLHFFTKRFNDIETALGLAEKHLGKKYATIIRQSVKKSDLFLDRYQLMLSDRVQSGFRRDLHGDLHCGNIFLYDDPLIFDCIEFNDEMRQIDVLDEIAFLCMDLDAFGRSDLSDYFYKNYLSFSGMQTDNDSTLLFNYFKFYRANVRAKIQLIYATETGDEAAFAQRMKAASRYLEILIDYQHYL